MRIKGILSVFVISFVIFNAANLYAEFSGEYPKGRGSRDQMIKELTETLGLTEEQQAKLKEHCDKKGRGGKGHRPDFIEELGITEEQQTLLEQHREKHMADMEKAREAMRAKKEELRKALDASDTDEATIKRIVKELNAAFAAMTQARVNGILGVKEILTPEQFEQFQQKHKERRGKMKKGMRHHRKGPPNEEPGCGPFSDESDMHMDRSWEE